MTTGISFSSFFSLFQLCCLSCSVGEEIGKVNGKCTSPYSSTHDERVQEECCERRSFKDEQELAPSALTNTNITSEANEDDSDEDPSIDKGIEDLLCPLGHSCEQDCEVRDGVAHCFCKKGFELAANKKSCNKIIDCERGFEYDERTGNCKGLNFTHLDFEAFYFET